MNATDPGDPSDADIAGLEANLAATTNALEAHGVTVQPGQNIPHVWWSTQNAMTISSVVLLFGALVITLAAFTAPKDTSMEGRLRFFGTIMIITMATFLVVAGYDDKQIAAPLGLLGTIAGYLLGRETAPRGPDAATTAAASPADPPVPASAPADAPAEPPAPSAQ